MPSDPSITGPAETVEIIRDARVPYGRWTPRVGPETTQLLAHLGLAAGGTTVRDEALSVLARCVPPSGHADTDTGLVIGYVQSGKTLSFTTVAALARDNGYQMVIVIAGVTNYLYGQSKTRLERDLRLGTRHDRPWIHFPKPTTANNTAGHIQGILQGWSDPALRPELRSTVLITVMKNKAQLNKLSTVLTGLDLSHVPALIIDDEADQAGLNTLVRQGDASATYSSLMTLRQRLPHHTYLQYTATPQAPLLINLIDVLSPSFAKVLTPGTGYVGGRQFFVDQPGLVRIIPPTEIPTPQAPLEGPPDSLQRALRLFFLGVASGLLRGGRGNRSMMAHPSMNIPQHDRYFSWVVAITSAWTATLALPPTDPDRQELLNDFRDSYEDLRSTVAGIEPFDELCTLLPHAIRSTQINKVNSNGSTSAELNWNGVYSHILVGGEILGRGFTIEGLTVTYMPRGIGVGNADTVQQRARFLGYKSSYLDHCRVYLESQVEDAYRKYVAHEEDIRDRLIRHDATGRPLSEWRRAFFLNVDLRPTRFNVLDLDYMQARISDSWFYPLCPHYSAAGVVRNRQLSNGLIGKLRWEPDAGHPERKEMQRHLVARNVPLRNVFDEFLMELKVPRLEDSQQFICHLLQIEAYLENNPGAVCTVYRMCPDEERRRGLDSDGEIKNLFQGEYPVEKARRGEIYPGDRAIKAETGLTMQIHRISLTDGGQVVARDVPVVALWTPAEMAADVLVQNQGGPTSPR